MLHKSIRWRIQAWHGLLLLCVVGALLVAFYSYERAEKLREIDSELQSTLTPLLPAILGPPGEGRDDFGGGPPDGPDNQRQPPGNQPRRPRSRGTADHLPESVRNGKIYYINWSPEGIVENRSSNAPTTPPPEERDDLRARTTLRTQGDFREALHHGPDGGVIAVGTSLAPMTQSLQRLALMLSLAGVSIVALGLVVGWWAAGRALQPLSKISETAEKISKGDLSKRIDVTGIDNELGQLATVLNNTFDKVERMIEEQLRFTADASHELRTPIAVLITQLQLALSRERSPAEYKQTLETCERAAERLRVLVNQLVELARIDSGDASLVWEKCDLSRVARDAVDFIEPLARKKNVTLNHSIDSIRLKADVMKLGQVFINLLNNAIHHNKEGIEVSLSVQRINDKAVIQIADNGIGIAKEALPHLFDRFYRVDKARARGKGNSGLGLAICKAIVEGHGGTIRGESDMGKGAAFIIELPLHRSAERSEA